MQLDPEILLRTVDAVLNPDEFNWTTQGFGMIRTYMDDAKEWRLNIWDERLRYVDEVSDIHDHPWTFRSWIIAGCLTNVRYDVAKITKTKPATHSLIQLVTGEEGGKVGEVEKARLVARPAEVYTKGGSYAQSLDQVHRTTYRRGTVTLNRRSTPTEAHTARVFFPLDTPWVDAMPREASDLEIYMATTWARGVLEDEAIMMDMMRLDEKVEGPPS